MCRTLSVFSDIQFDRDQVEHSTRCTESPWFLHRSGHLGGRLCPRREPPDCLVSLQLSLEGVIFVRPPQLIGALGLGELVCEFAGELVNIRGLTKRLNFLLCRIHVHAGMLAELLKHLKDRR